MEHWYALYTKPYKEQQVRCLLESKGFEAYLPAIKIRRNGQWKVKPFFSCYLFVRADTTNGPFALRWTPGLKRIVSFGDQPALINDHVISYLKQRLAKAQESGCGVHQFQPGDRVTITSGPLSHLEAVFERGLSAGQRASILVDFLGRWTSCRVEMDCLKKAR